MPVEVKCMYCGTIEQVIPARSKTYKFCSYACRGAWRKQHWKGENHPNWKGGEREKDCQHCGVSFTQNPTEAISTFRNRKFCSKTCADIGGFRYSGKDHPSYREDARRRNRGDGHAKWAKQVISRDMATCQSCGAQDVELHAHHVKPYKDHPELRDDLANGVTLCYKCHWDAHSADIANGVNSGKPAARNGGGNPEPSLDGNILEGVTTRGRAYRRWNGNCPTCGAFISRRLSDVKGKSFVACSRHCAGKHNQKLRNHGNGSNTSTSALHESDDIV